MKMTIPTNILEVAREYMPWVAVFAVLVGSGIILYHFWDLQNVKNAETIAYDKTKTSYLLGEISHACMMIGSLHDDIETNCQKYAFDVTGKTPEELQAMLDKYPPECSSTDFVFRLLGMDCSGENCSFGMNIPPYCKYVLGENIPIWNETKWLAFSTVK